MPRVFASHIAKRDVENIWNFIADDNIKKADEFVVGFTNVCEMLAHNPEVGLSRDRILFGLRSFPFKKYMIYYFVVIDGIEVYRLIHSARNVEGLFEVYFENL